MIFNFDKHGKPRCLEERGVEAARLAERRARAFVYRAQTGDARRGAAALFALGLGMVLPLPAFGTFGAGILPKSGPWLGHVKHLFGFVFVGLAIWIAARIFPD